MQRSPTLQNGLQQIRLCEPLELDVAEENAVLKQLPVPPAGDAHAIMPILRMIPQVLHLRWDLEEEELRAIAHHVQLGYTGEKDGNPLLGMARVVKTLYYHLHPGELDMLEAFVSLGGCADRTGHADALLIKEICDMQELSLPGLVKFLRRRSSHLSAQASSASFSASGHRVYAVVQEVMERMKTSSTVVHDPIGFLDFMELLEGPEGTTPPQTPTTASNPLGKFGNMQHSGTNQEEMAGWSETRSLTLTDGMQDMDFHFVSPAKSFAACSTSSTCFREYTDAPIARAMHRRLRNSLSQHAAVCANYAPPSIAIMTKRSRTPSHPGVESVCSVRRESQYSVLSEAVAESANRPHTATPPTHLHPNSATVKRRSIAEAQAFCHEECTVKCITFSDITEKPTIEEGNSGIHQKAAQPEGSSPHLKEETNHEVSVGDCSVRSQGVPVTLQRTSTLLKFMCSAAPDIPDQPAASPSQPCSSAQQPAQLHPCPSVVDAQLKSKKKEKLQEARIQEKTLQRTMAKASASGRCSPHVSFRPNPCCEDRPAEEPVCIEDLPAVPLCNGVTMQLLERWTRSDVPSLVRRKMKRGAAKSTAKDCCQMTMHGHIKKVDFTVVPRSMGKQGAA